MRTRHSGESALLLLDVVDLLLGEQIDYAVVGAMAASVHGVLRASMDADAVLSITTQRLGQLEERFRAAGFSGNPIASSWRRRLHRDETIR